MDELKSLVTLLKASRSVEKLIEKNIASSGLSLSEFMVMEVLYSKETDLPIQEIAKKVLLSSGSMTYVINQLVSRGWIKRFACEEDKRVNYVALTQEGQQKIRSAFQVHQVFIDDLFKVLNESEKQTYTQLNKKIGLHAQQQLESQGD